MEGTALEGQREGGVKGARLEGQRGRVEGVGLGGQKDGDTKSPEHGASGTQRLKGHGVHSRRARRAARRGRALAGPGVNSPARGA